MPSAYIQDDDKAAYGVPDATAQQILKASILIDAYLNRPEGVIYVPTAAGIPGYMESKKPNATLKVPAGISPGQNVVVTVTGPAGLIEVGMPLVCDRTAVNDKLEVPVVTVVNGQQLTLNAIAIAHGADVTLEAGMVITETNYLPKDRPLMQLAKTPVARAHSAQGRYGFGRRGDRYSANMSDFNLLATVQNFGGPPAWESFAISSSNVDAQTGQVWVPSGVLMAYYSEVRVHYVAGWEYANMPDPIKMACAQMVETIDMYKDLMGGNISMAAAGDHKIQRFAASVIDKDIQASLNAYRSNQFG